jgi:hypothetical protein
MRNRRGGLIEMDAQIGRTPKTLVKRIQSWVGCALVLIGAGFFLLTLREGSPEPYQDFVDSIFHNWMAMGLLTIALWMIRRVLVDVMPRGFEILLGFLLLFSALITGLGLVGWGPLWTLLQQFQIPQAKAQPLAAFVLIAAWFLVSIGFVFRGVFRWIFGRYEHHGVGVRSGPFFFYFRRRRIS